VGQIPPETDNPDDLPAAASPQRATMMDAAAEVDDVAKAYLAHMDQDYVTGTVSVVDHDGSWAAAYEVERAVIRSSLSEFDCLIEHVGSTAVPGLAAKPVIDIDVVVMSDEIGVAKPDARFFAAVLDRLGRRPDEVLYVGDRLDNDILPARHIGMFTVFIRRRKN
jgi:GrpB-like predicted nucleotidyltransferase (UPF0157 family)